MKHREALPDAFSLRQPSTLVASQVVVLRPGALQLPDCGQLPAPALSLLLLSLLLLSLLLLSRAGCLDRERRRGPQLVVLLSVLLHAPQPGQLELHAGSWSSAPQYSCIQMPCAQLQSGEIRPHVWLGEK
jgi:hypothetical protein|eukprot:COSAG06_NODE_7130_length_2619_cov_3.931199_2_plen_130_part_00